MSFNGTGVYQLPSPAYPPVSGTKISSANYQTIMSDIATALSLCLVRDGQAAMTGNLNMGSQRIVGVANAINPQDALTLAQLTTSISNTQKAALTTAVDTGVADAYVAALSPAPAALTPGMIFSVSNFVGTNTGPSTLTLNAFAVLPIQAVGGQALQGGELVAGYSGVFRVNAAATAYELLVTTGGTTQVVPGTGSRHAVTLNQLQLASTPAGALLAYAGGVVPAGYLLANGAAVSRTTYAALFAAIGTTWGVGDGATTFNLPDSRGVMLRGLDGGRGLDTGRALGTYQADSFASHGHTISDPGHGHSVADPGHSHGLNGQTIQGGSNSAPSAATDTNARPLSGWTKGAGTGIGIYGAGTGISINANGSTETVSKNIAVNYIIKY